MIYSTVIYIIYFHKFFPRGIKFTVYNVYTVKPEIASC